MTKSRPLRPLAVLAPAACGRTRIKVCGLTREEDVDAAVAAGVDAIGFVLYKPSPRFVDAERAAQLARRLPPAVSPVLLFVNASLAEIQHAASLVPSAVLQFHGDESANDCQRAASTCQRWYWRAARLPTQAVADFDLLGFCQQHQEAQALLLDTLSEGYGGSGHSFDWQALPKQVPAHLILSGGLSADNVGQGIAALRGRGRSLAVDVSSGVEARDADGRALKGIKDSARIEQFVAAVRAADTFFQSNEVTQHVRLPTTR